jgi:hypothetical protein
VSIDIEIRDSWHVTRDPKEEKAPGERVQGRNFCVGLLGAGEWVTRLCPVCGTTARLQIVLSVHPPPAFQSKLCAEDRQHNATEDGLSNE